MTINANVPPRRIDGMDPEHVASPARLVAHWRGLAPPQQWLDYEDEWWRSGEPLSAAIDRGGTPPLWMYDRFGQRIDTIGYPPGYRELLLRGYRAGVVADAIDTASLLPGYAVGYLTAFFDPGLYCPYTVSLGTAVALHKFGAGPDCQAWLEHMTRRDADVWQGATWLTESGGGSDLGRNVHTRAEATDGAWVLTGEKYFASNVGAELAVVAARRDDAPAGIRGLGLYAMPRGRADGSLNYRVRRLKNKIATRSVPTGEVELDRAEALELAPPGEGVYPIMEILNVSRIANSIGSVACIQRALHEGWRFARRRHAFGAPVAEQPLFRRQLEQWQQTLADAFALAWAAADELDAVWLEQRPYSPRYHRFRLLAHLAKYWTAHQAIACARWAMEALGGNGAIADFGVERLLREAMILSIWEGTPHRQMLDGLEVMQREQAHEALFAWLGEPDGTGERRQRIEALLAQDEAVRSAGIEPVFDDLAAWVARCLSVRLPAPQ